MDVDQQALAPVFQANGRFLGGGLSGIVELLPDGHVLKSPWPGEEESQQDIRTESQVYGKLAEHLGTHPRFIEFIAFDQERLALTMEYMENGTLRDYLRSSIRNQDVSRQQRYVWIHAIAEGLDILHSLDILHCDLTPHNLLLDKRLQLKIGDFGCASIDGSISTAGTNPRFYPSRSSWSTPVTFGDDLFALGSCIYEVLTGAAPFQEMPSPQARVLVTLLQFPDLTGLECGAIIRDCWLLQARSARHVRARIEAELK